jgi:hypothetical protein
MSRDEEEDANDFTKRSGELLMEFPLPVKSIKRVGDRLFVTLMDGQVIDCTDLLGEAKQ